MRKNWWGTQYHIFSISYSMQQGLKSLGLNFFLTEAFSEYCSLYIYTLFRVQTLICIKKIFPRPHSIQRRIFWTIVGLCYAHSRRCTLNKFYMQAIIWTYWQMQYSEVLTVRSQAPGFRNLVSYKVNRFPNTVTYKCAVFNLRKFDANEKSVCRLFSSMCKIL